MSYKIHTCQFDHAGNIPQMKEEVLQKHNASAASNTSRVEIIKYTCPYCGYILTKVMTHGVPINSADRTTLNAAYTNVQIS